MEAEDGQLNFLAYGVHNRNAVLCDELLAAVDVALARYESLKREHALHLRHHDELHRSNGTHKRMVEQLLQDVTAHEDRMRTIVQHMQKREAAVCELYDRMEAEKEAEAARLETRIAEAEQTTQAILVQIDRMKHILSNTEAQKQKQASTSTAHYEPLPATEGSVTLYQLVPKALPPSFPVIAGPTAAQIQTEP
eukprot:GGOE01020406.1.p1 GENE.GGOE01020406.1~~GGOE01020406.1.p1  ORF type:complete len:194 (-),score=44.46 GGOE01020406.1:304-885(-)